MTVAMALYNAKAEAIGIIIIQPNQEIFFICSLFALGLVMVIALDRLWLWLWLKLHHFYKLDNNYTWTRVGECRKIPAFCLLGVL